MELLPILGAVFAQQEAFQVALMIQQTQHQMHMAAINAAQDGSKTIRA